MKNKISFTSVLKSKGSRHINISSTQSQSRMTRLIDLYEEFQINPNKSYTLELNLFKVTSQKSRNSSMLKSSHTNEDPQINLDEWVQQTRQNYQSITKGSIQKSKGILTFQQQTSHNRRSRSNFNKPQIYPSQDEEYNSYQSNQFLENSKKYELTQMEQSKKTYQKNLQKPSLHYQSQQINQVQPEKIFKPKPQNQQSQLARPEEILVSEQLKPKSYFSNMEDQDYKKLQEEFQRLKQQKITELCMQTKKSIKKEKLEQVISKALENIYEDIEEMAGQIIMKRRMDTELKKLPCQEEVSEQMLISGSNDYQQQKKLNQSLESENNYGEQKRKQEMRNMIKGYISGIQEAKSQGKASMSFNSSKGVSKNESEHRQTSYVSLSVDNQGDSQEPSFNYHSNTFSNQINDFSSINQIESYRQKIQNVAKNSIPDSVGYSFANSNMVCQHSFNKELMDHNQFQNQFSYTEQNRFLKNHVNPPVYEPENFDSEEEQKISLPNIQEVKSDCGDFTHEQLQQSEGIEFKRNKMQNLTLDITGNNIKNIESVHYEPPAESFGYQGFQAHNERKDIFKNFQQPSYQSTRFEYNNLKSDSRKESNLEKDEILKEQIIPSHQDQKFVSKTFSSYLSGEMRSQYGQAIRDVPKQPNNQSYSSKQSEFGYYIEPTNRYLPLINKLSAQKINVFSKHEPQEKSFRSVSSPRKQHLTIIKNSENSQNLVNSNVKNQTIMNESSQLSLNNSMNQSPKNLQKISSKNIHQLQSKNKFSIKSPITKIDEIIQNQEKPHNQTKITEFNGQVQKNITNFQLSKIPSSSNSYAISSPIGNYKINDNIPFPSSKIPQNLINDHKYACAQQISSKVEDFLNKPLKEQRNSILLMQPLKLSLQNSINAEKIQKIQKQTSKLSIYTNQKITQSQQIDQTTIQTLKIETLKKPVVSSKISSGRSFLQSLHEKQSIEIEMSPESKKQVAEQKNSFVAQTFRPTTIVTQQNVKPPSILNDSHSISSNQKASTTKINLRSSDRNNPGSPIVISLSINQFPQKVVNMSVPGTDNKQNVFEKLTIKKSKNLQTSADTKGNLTSSIHHQSTKISQTSNTQNHADMNSKENNNTMNKCITKIQRKAQLSTYQRPNTSIVTQKREPLLKLSKNFGNAVTQQSMSVKKSIGESIKTKVHPISSMVSSKGFSIAANPKLSIKNVKQSIGNDSDMDFDLELD